MVVTYTKVRVTKSVTQVLIYTKIRRCEWLHWWDKFDNTHTNKNMYYNTLVLVKQKGLGHRFRRESEDRCLSHEMEQVCCKFAKQRVQSEHGECRSPFIGSRPPLLTQRDLGGARWGRPPIIDNLSTMSSKTNDRAL